MGQVGSLYVFSPNTVIFSSYVNSNFSDIKNTYNAHDIATTGVHGAGAGSLVTTTGTQTLTNKTLTSPIVNTPSITNATLTASNANVTLSVPTNSVQSILATTSAGVIVDQDVYISPQYDISAGVTLVSGGGTLSSIQRAVAIFYRVGTIWNAKIRLGVVLSQTTRTAAVFGFSDISFQTSGGVGLALAAVTNNFDSFSVMAEGIVGFGASNRILVEHSSITSYKYYINCDVELSAKPTAYLPAGV